MEGGRESSGEAGVAALGSSLTRQDGQAHTGAQSVQPCLLEQDSSGWGWVLRGAHPLPTTLQHLALTSSWER